MTELTLSRRVLATRDAAWARRLARMLGRTRVSPNAVSVAGVGCALVACAAFASAPAAIGVSRGILFAVAAAAIQLRLLCNLLDGMLAVEEGLATPLGDLYNEIPDRLADIAILLGAGAAARDLTGGLALGCAAAIAALFTAYVRLLGGSLGLTQHFTGPMAKQHRMFVLTIAAVCGAVESSIGLPPQSIRAALAVIAAGAIATACRRLRLIAWEMEAR
jgi:phosphatidylglycerophosphate synthase